MKVLSLFTGAGGFDLGLEAARFEIAGCLEVDKDATATIRMNRPRWPCMSGDIHEQTPARLLGSFQLEPRKLTILTAGPPCQPFSKSGFWATGTTRRLEDPRSRTLSAVIELVDFALPDIMLIENVKGISLNGQNDVIGLIQAGLERINGKNRTLYRLQILNVNASNYGVPQVRERTFLFAHREGEQLRLPEPTHVATPASANSHVDRLTTAWDAIGHLDSSGFDEAIRARGKWADLLPSIPEGHNYLWHTERGGGSPLFGWRTKFWTFLLKLAKARPSWTLQASPGPSTGPFHWRNRLLSIEEICRLQTLPSGYTIYGSYSSARRQVGNAVPSAIGELLGFEIRKQLFCEAAPDELSLIPKLRDDCPAPEDIAPVAPKYFVLLGKHPAHPGPGLGPGARRMAPAT